MVLYFSLIAISLILGYFSPPLFNLKSTIPIVLGFSLFLSFLLLPLGRNIKKNIKYLLFSSIYRFFILPTLLYIIKYFFFINIPNGVFLIAMAPTGLGAVLLLSQTKYKSELIAHDVIFQNLLSIFLIPLISSLYLSTHMNPQNLGVFVLKLFIMIIVPFSFSFIVKKIFKNLSNYKKIISKINVTSLMYIIFIASNLAFYKLKTTNNINYIYIFSPILIGMINYFIGTKLSRNPLIKANTSIIIGYRNTSLTIWIAISFFDYIDSIPAVVYIIVQHTLNIFTLSILHIKDSKRK